MSVACDGWREITKEQQQQQHKSGLNQSRSMLGSTHMCKQMFLASALKRTRRSTYHALQHIVQVVLTLAPLALLHTDGRHYSQAVRDRLDAGAGLQARRETSLDAPKLPSPPRLPCCTAASTQKLPTCKFHSLIHSRCRA